MQKKFEELKLYFKDNALKICLIIVILILYVTQFIIMNYLINSIINKKNEDNVDVSINLEKEETLNEPILEYIYVDIKGSVKKPNVYKLLKGSRVNDLVSLAGGLTKNANTRFINLSKILNDGEVVVIYSNSEIEKAKKTNTIYVNTPCVCEEIKNDACYNEETDENLNTSDGKININTSSLEELMTLSGIGESKAKAIIEYREKNGSFKNIEDIVNVSGISETIYAKIKNNITI